MIKGGFQHCLKYKRLHLKSSESFYFSAELFGFSLLFSLLSLECETQQDVDDYYKALTARGVSTLGAPRRHPVHPVYSFFMRDPSGYTVEIQKIIG